jgi:hypothetical protein
VSFTLQDKVISAQNLQDGDQLQNRGINLRIILKLVLREVMKFGAVFMFVGLRTEHVGRIFWGGGGEKRMFLPVT